MFGTGLLFLEIVGFGRESNHVHFCRRRTWRHATDHFWDVSTLPTSEFGPNSIPSPHVLTAAAIASYKARRLQHHQMLGAPKAAEDSRRIGRPPGARDSRPRKKKTTSSSPASTLAVSLPVADAVATFTAADLPVKEQAILSPRAMVSAERNRDHVCPEKGLLGLTSLLTATRSGRPPPWQGPRGPPATVVWPTGEQGEGRHTDDAADDPSTGRALRLKLFPVTVGRRKRRFRRNSSSCQ